MHQDTLPLALAEVTVGHRDTLSTDTDVPTLRQLRAHIPMSSYAQRMVPHSRETIWNILDGTDPRLLVVVGPCSIHDPAAAIEYAGRLGELSDHLSDVMFPVMRTYFEKPRTTTGWKGLISDPFLDGSGQIGSGLRIARRLLSDIVELGVPTATEALEPLAHPLIQDFIAWTSIGARTCESQTHRVMASGLETPVGIKNATDGRIDPAANGIIAASHPHQTIGVTEDGRVAVVSTSGNRRCHLVLRGGSRPNFALEDVLAAHEALCERGIRTGLVVDCSHANSGKDPMRQREVLDSILTSRRRSGAMISGVMIESFLQDGSQSLGAGPLTYGQSITDACIGWDKTRDMLLRASDTLREYSREELFA